MNYYPMCTATSEAKTFSLLTSNPTTTTRERHLGGCLQLASLARKVTIGAVICALERFSQQETKIIESVGDGSRPEPD